MLRNVTLRIVKYMPGQSAPVSGWHRPISVQGFATGQEVFAELGHALPDAALGFMWRLKPPPLSGPAVSPAVWLLPGRASRKASYADASGLVLQPPWQMLGPLEAADGMLLFGISTAFIFTVMQFYYQRLVLRTPADRAARAE